MHPVEVGDMHDGKRINGLIQIIERIVNDSLTTVGNQAAQFILVFQLLLAQPVIIQRDRL